MKILHTADWHLGKLLEGRSRLEEQKIVMEQNRKSLWSRWWLWPTNGRRI